LAQQPRSRWVYVNRNLRLDSVEVFGFDMDYTLAIYRQPALEALSVECTLRKLVEDRGYPEEIKTISFDTAFALRGLVVDKDHGNILKMDRHAFVGRAYHGTRELSREERRARYSEERIDAGQPRYACIDTLFALPEVCMFAALVDLFGEMKKPVNYRRLWQDIREAIDEAHRDDSIKRVIKAEINKFIVYDPELPLTLHKLRSAGKKLFLLTNSEWHYTDAVMKFLLDGALPNYATWQSYFDVTVVKAQKPLFFTGQEPLLVLDENGEAAGEASGPLERSKVYQGGNLQALERGLGIRGDRILYVGDHIYGDMLRSKKSGAWRTAMIIQEMEDELAVAEQHKHEQGEIAALETQREQLEQEINYRNTLLLALPKAAEHQPGISAELLEQSKKDLKLELDRLRREQRGVIDKLNDAFRSYEKRMNPYWGSIFKDGNENSRFGEQVDDYACVYTSRVSNFLYYSMTHYFVAPPDSMPHERSLPGEVAPVASAPGVLSAPKTEPAKE
jgi:HAD superfamily 5'-nucleotidase-like hydrolase